METIDGSANEGEDYEPLNEILTFEPNETEKEVCFFYISLVSSTIFMISKNSTRIVPFKYFRFH